MTEGIRSVLEFETLEEYSEWVAFLNEHGALLDYIMKERFRVRGSIRRLIETLQEVEQ